MTTECKAGICILITICVIVPMVIMMMLSKKWRAKQAAGGDAYVVHYSSLGVGIGTAGIIFF